MARAERKKLIEKLERLRGSKVLCYLTGDRAPVAAQIGDALVATRGIAPAREPTSEMTSRWPAWRPPS